MNCIQETLSQVVGRGGHSESDLLVRVRALGLRLAGIAGCEPASRW
jgi:hypothetical protein